jgi:large subunit ribosomal protein L6
MSRVGKKIIKIPSGVEVKIQDQMVSVKGGKGSLQQLLPVGITASVKDGVLTAHRANETPQVRALHGMARSLLNNMVEGVSQPYQLYDG